MNNLGIYWQGLGNLLAKIGESTFMDSISNLYGNSRSWNPGYIPPDLFWNILDEFQQGEGSMGEAI